MPSQVGPNSALPSLGQQNDLDRRDFLRRVGFTTGLACLGATGCVPVGQGPLPDLVWGRRGIAEGRFVKPRAITIDRDDLLYIVDTTGRIQVFDTEGELQRYWQTPKTANGRPTGLAMQYLEGEEDARVLVADTHYYRMLVFSDQGELIESAQIGGTAGHLPGEFAFVTDAVSDNQGCFYIGEYNASDRIQKFDPHGEFIMQWGGNGHEPGKFFRPQSLVVQDDILWVVDACNHRIQRFDISSDEPKLIDVWGQAGEGKGQFYYPYDMAIASDGTIVVVEYKNNRIQRLAPDGKWIATWGGPGLEPGRLNGPWGVVIDSRDNVHILDSSNHRIQRIRLPS